MEKVEYRGMTFFVQGWASIPFSVDGQELNLYLPVVRDFGGVRIAPCIPIVGNVPLSEYKAGRSAPTVLLPAPWAYQLDSRELELIEKELELMK